MSVFEWLFYTGFTVVYKGLESFFFWLQHNRAKKGHCEVFTVNPKCVKLGELYGETDPNTYDWSDGLIAMAVRKFSKELIKHGSGDDRPSTSGSVMTDHTRVCLS